MKEQVKVSIIMPSLNVVEYIDECMRSVISQTLKEIEIISVDAGSTDGTREKLQEYARNDQRIILIDSDIKSYGKQVNIGIQRASGEYVAILETDDYVALNMYEVLYEIARDNRPDFVYADFDMFFSIKNTERIFNRYFVLNNYKTLYDELLGKKALHKLFKHNITIWGGIYKREFLLDNHILCSESSKAAYQDIGFLHQILMKAYTGMFCNESLYRYRMDRDLSSSNSKYGLIYSYNEYKRFVDEFNIEVSYRKQFYYFMLLSFEEQAEGVLPKLNYELTEDNKVAYDWFVKMFHMALREKYVEEADFDEEVWTKINMLIDSVDEFVATIKEHKEQINCWKEAKDKKYIIFGAGVRGTHLYGSLVGETDICAFCDNNEKVWGSKIGDVPVLSLEECQQRWSEASYIICVKNHTKEIKKQLIESGVSENQIEEYKKV